MFLFGSSYQYQSFISIIISFLEVNIFLFLGYTYGAIIMNRDYSDMNIFLRFYGENIKIDSSYSVLYTFLIFILFNYLVFLSGKLLKFKKINITEINKNYFLIYSKFVPTGYIVSNFILGGNSNYSYLKVFLYGLLGVIMNLSFVGIIGVVYYFINLENYYFRDLVNFLAFIDLIVCNLIFIIFSFIYFRLKK